MSKYQVWGLLTPPPTGAEFWILYFSISMFWSYTKGENLTTMLSEFLFLDMSILVKVLNINSHEYEIGHNAGKDEKQRFL